MGGDKDIGMGNVVNLFEKEEKQGEYPGDALEVGEEFWRCNCGCFTFYLTRDGAKCKWCGLVSSQWAE